MATAGDQPSSSVQPCSGGTPGQHPLADRGDERRVLDGGQEPDGRQQAVDGVLPADERLDAVTRPCELDGRLVVQHELARGPGVLHVAEELQPVEASLLEVPRETRPCAAPGVLGREHGEVAVAEQRVGGGGVAGHGQPDRGPDTTWCPSTVYGWPHGQHAVRRRWPATSRVAALR